MIPGAQVVSTDEFWDGEGFDIERLAREVVDAAVRRRRPPASRPTTGRRGGRGDRGRSSRRASWSSRASARSTARSATRTPCGSGSRRRTTCGSRAASPATARRRARTWVDVWMPSEDRYVERDDPVSCAHLVVDNGADAPATAARPARRRRLSARASSPERLLERRRGRAARDRAAVDRDDRHHLADRRRREHLVGGEEPLEREDALLDRLARARGELEQGRPRLAGEDADLERRRQEHVALPPPDVRHRALEHDAVRVDEDRVVGAARLRLGLGGDADGVARRLRRGEQPRRRPPLVEQRDEPLAALARLLDPVGDRADERDRAVLAAGRPRRPVEPQDRLGRAGVLERERREALELRRGRAARGRSAPPRRRAGRGAARTGTAGRRRPASSRTRPGRA